MLRAQPTATESSPGAGTSSGSGASDALPYRYSMGNIAGMSGRVGCDNGYAAAATFDSPFGLVVDRRGSLLVSDAHSHCVRRVVRDAVFEIQYLNVSGVSVTACECR